MQIGDGNLNFVFIVSGPKGKVETNTKNRQQKTNFNLIGLHFTYYRTLRHFVLKNHERTYLHLHFYLIFKLLLM